MYFHFKKKSANRKTGPIPVTVSDPKTCPPTCPLMHNGCYYEDGFYTRLHWQKIADGVRGTDWTGLIKNVLSIPMGQIWRHNVGGDLPGFGNLIDRTKLTDLVNANRGKRGFTYTHKPITEYKPNADAVRDANANGFTINLSANNLAHADELKALNVAPVVVVVPEDTDRLTYTPAGNKVVVCPAQQKDNVTCASCGLCAIADRKAIIGFRAHGMNKRKVSNLVK